MTELQLEVNGLEQVRSAMTRQKGRLKDFKKLFQRISIVLQQRFAKKFEQSGPGWKGLSPVTILLTRPHKPLQLTGVLKNSLGSPRSRGSIRSITRSKLEFGTKVPYASAMNKGQTIQVTAPMQRLFGVRGIPLTIGTSLITPGRKFFVIDSGDMAKIDKTIEQWAKQQVEGAI